KYPHRGVAGNHDWASIGKVDISDFNPYAATAAHWTARHLTDEATKYLEQLPLTLTSGDFTLAHGSPREPIWEYVVSTHIAKDNFPCFETKYCLVGHSHVPAIFEHRGDSCLSHDLTTESPLRLEDNRLIINPGGVGQPRDGDPRAAYAIYNSTENSIYHYRVPYDIEETQRKMIRWGLPISLANRLTYGR
ncbi:MAG: metallophosphoesterase family protein, partial [Chloroflexota bacterium]